MSNPQSGTPADSSSSKSKSKILPSNRIAVAKQIEILRAYAAAFVSTNIPVTNAEVASIVKMAANTVSIGNAFFTNTGLLDRNNGGYIPAAETIQFYRAYEWSPETAPHKLAPLIGRTWFSKALLAKLRFRQMDEEEAISELAQAAEVGPDYKVNLRMLLEYMEVTDIIVRDNGIIRLSPPSPNSESEVHPVSGTVPVESDKPNQPMRNLEQVTETVKPGGISFTVHCNVDMKEINTWSADRITAFFAGVAQVLAAKAGGKENEV